MNNEPNEEWMPTFRPHPKAPITIVVRVGDWARGLMFEWRGVVRSLDVEISENGEVLIRRRGRYGNRSLGSQYIVSGYAVEVSKDVGYLLGMALRSTVDEVFRATQRAFLRLKIEP